MKRLTLFGVLLTLGLFMSTPVFSYDYDVKIDGIYYDLTSDSTACVTYSELYAADYSGEVTIPTSINDNGKVYSVKGIGSQAFYGCSGLTSVTIPNSVTRIGYQGFLGCSGLTSVTIPNSVKSIGEEAFCGCSGLTSVSIPKSIESISDYAFCGCSGLTSVKIPNSVTEIGMNAFSGCSGLTSVTIPNSVKSIDKEAFSGCSALTSVILGKSVTAISSTAFEDCGDIVFEVLSDAPLARLSELNTKEIILGKGFEEMYITNWKEWTSFEKIYAKDSTPPVISDSFSEYQKKNLQVIVPTEALEAYKAAPVWKDFWLLEGGAETAGVEGVTLPTADEDLPVYGLDGRRVKTTVPEHIYIKGGKKFVAQ